MADQVQIDKPPFPELACEVCGQKAQGVYSSVMGAISHAYCHGCLEDGCEVWSTLVGGLYGCGGGQAAEWTRPIITATCAFYKKTEEELWAEVAKLEVDYEAYMKAEDIKSRAKAPEMREMYHCSRCDHDVFVNWQEPEDEHDFIYGRGSCSDCNFQQDGMDWNQVMIPFKMSTEIKLTIFKQAEGIYAFRFSKGRTTLASSGPYSSQEALHADLVELIKCIQSDDFPVVDPSGLVTEVNEQPVVGTL